MRPVRRLIVAGALLGAGIGIIGNAPSASAYCNDPRALDDGPSARSCHVCPESPRLLEKYGLGWECLQ